jgi:anti-sigma28 factor (negative regulator of flagellin synthesis)
MSIRNIANPYGPQRATPATPAAPATPAKGAVAPAAPPAPAAPRTDSVQISDAGRALAGAEGGQRAAPLDAERVAELRRKVLEGAYNSAQVVDQVAQRILKSGEL